MFGLPQCSPYVMKTEVQLKLVNGYQELGLLLPDADVERIIAAATAEFAAYGVAGHRGGERFQRDGPSEPPVLREIDDAHPPATDLADDLEVLPRDYWNVILRGR